MTVIIRLVCWSVFGDGYHPESCGDTFLVTHYLFVTVCDVASNHGEFYVEGQPEEGEVGSKGGPT